MRTQKQFFGAGFVLQREIQGGYYDADYLENYSKKLNTFINQKTRSP
jgi:hypothetical protein